jgi:hypothetical protein
MNTILPLGVGLAAGFVAGLVVSRWRWRNTRSGIQTVLKELRDADFRELSELTEGLDSAEIGHLFHRFGSRWRRFKVRTLKLGHELSELHSAFQALRTSWDGELEALRTKIEKVRDKYYGDGRGVGQGGERP